MERTNPLLTLLVAVVAVSVVAKGSLAAPLPELVSDLPKTQPASLPPPSPILQPTPPVPILQPTPPAPILPPTPPAPILPPTPILPPAPILPPVPMLPPLLPPAPLPLPPIPALGPFAPVPTPPDTSCYPALLTCKNTSTSDPSKICCDNLKIVYENGTDCICKVVKSPELSKELGLTATDVSKLLLECKITNTSTCICTAPAPAPSEATILTTKLAWISTTVVLYLCFLMV